MSRVLSPRQVLNSYRLDSGLYVLGTFSSGVTIYSQQVRALNLAWAMTKCLSRKDLANVAIIGGGFAGTTLAAALAKKGVPNIALFEKRPVLFPLQQGSDTRWIHPHIYDWPEPNSELPSAGLPLINWHAGRASDAVVQATKEWRELSLELQRPQNPLINVREICGVKYLQVGVRKSIQWLSSLQAQSDCGQAERFSSIVIALGFGEEAQSPGTVSYWRNESLGQPELNPGVRRFLISGYGDGALVDLFRLRLEQFRQDRILGEIFHGEDELIKRLRHIKIKLSSVESLEAAFDELFKSSTSGHQAVLDRVRGRLRRDTFAILHLKAGSLAEVYKHKSSFQNKVLLYLLFSVGGFIPSHRDLRELATEHKIESHNILLRHGTDRVRVVTEVLSPALRERLTGQIEGLRKRAQVDQELWEGGYWGQPASKLWRQPIDSDKVSWRKEYLPAATEIVAAAFCSAVAGLIRRSSGNDFRVTLHRTIHVGGTPLLQQACEYFGTETRPGSKGRTFGVDQGIIGLAYSEKKVCRTIPSKRAISSSAVQRDAERLRVGRDAQKLKASVRSVLAIPLISGDRVSMVLFADSTATAAFNDALVSDICAAANEFLRFVAKVEIGEIRNYQSEDEHGCLSDFKGVRLATMEILKPARQPPPAVKSTFTFNLETSSDRAPVGAAKRPGYGDGAGS